MRKLTSIFLFLLSNVCFAQSNTLDSITLEKEMKFKYQVLILPSTLIGFGVIGLESHAIKNLNSSTKKELSEHIDNKLTIDDISQYAPFVSVFALNAAGIRAKNSIKDQSIILATSYIIMGSTVNIIKLTGNEMRPDGTSNNSFPSGHTATAFMGAELLYQEYKEVSIWYGVSGYAVAAGTGFFRMYNNRHWLTDISAGAGIGILSTKIAYWIHPIIKKTFFKKSEKLSGLILPTYNNGKLGAGIVMNF